MVYHLVIQHGWEIHYRWRFLAGKTSNDSRVSPFALAYPVVMTHIAMDNGDSGPFVNDGFP